MVSEFFIQRIYNWSMRHSPCRHVCRKHIEYQAKAKCNEKYHRTYHRGIHRSSGSPYGLQQPVAHQPQEQKSLCQPQ